jgi:hypothetical protein
VYDSSVFGPRWSAAEPSPVICTVTAESNGMAAISPRNRVAALAFPRMSFW